MTREQAEELSKWLTEILDGRKLWSATVSECRKSEPDKPTRYRVVLQRLGSSRPVAIYSGRILTKPVEQVKP